MSANSISALLPVPDSQAPSDLTELGRVVDAYSIQGWIKIQPFAVGSATLRKAKQVWLCKGDLSEQQGALMQATVVNTKLHGAVIVAQLAGVTDRNQAETWRGWTVCVPRSSFAKPAPDEFYFVDLISCIVYTPSGQLMGVVHDVMESSAHAILRVYCYTPDSTLADPQPLLDAKGQVTETLIPFVAALVPEVDIANKRLVADWSIE